MRLLPDENKDQLFGKDLPLPSALEWDKMEAGILAKMEAKKPFYQRPMFRWSTLLLVIIVGFGALISTFYEVDKNDDSSTTTTLVEQTITNSTKVTENSEADKRRVNDAIDPISTLIIAPKQAAEDSNWNPKESIENLGSLTTATKIEESTSPLSPTSSLEQEDVEKKRLSTDQQMPLADKPKAIQDQALPTKAVEFTIDKLETTAPEKRANALFNRPSYSFISQLPLNSYAPSIEKQHTFTAVSTPISKPPSFRASTKYWRLLAQSGINIFNSKYSGANREIISLRNASEHLDIGSQLELRVERKISRKWFVGTGLGHQTYRRRLEVEAQSNFQRLYTDVLISYNQDPISGEISNEIYADTLLTVSQLRKIRHFNSYTSWEIPIYLGIQQQKGRWNFAGTFGITISVNRQMNGRVFDADGEVGTLGNEQFLRYDTNSSAAYQFEGRASYRLLDGVDIHASLARQQFIGNWMTNSNNALTSRPGIWRLNLGSSLKF